MVAQPDRVVDNLCELRMTGRLSVASECQHVGQLSVIDHLPERLFQMLGYLLALGEGKGRTVVFIETTLTVDAVERTYFSVGRQQVDAQ